VTVLPWRNVGIAVEQSAIGRLPDSDDPASAEFGYLRHQTSAALVLRPPFPPWDWHPTPWHEAARSMATVHA